MNLLGNTAKSLFAARFYSSNAATASTAAKKGASMEITIWPLIASGRQGSASADTLFKALYSELHGLAKRELNRKAGFASLSVTTLLHEAYLDISARNSASFPDQASFMGYAAKVMRGIIIDYTRNRRALKRGGEYQITSIEDEFAVPADLNRLSSISDALDELTKVEPELAEVVDLKFFCGFTFAEIASMQRISERTVQRRWEKARIYLHCSITADLT